MVEETHDLIDADGLPIKVGDKVYIESDNNKLVRTVTKIEERKIFLEGKGKAFWPIWEYPENLTHTLPNKNDLLDVDGVPIKIGDTVYTVIEDGREDEWTVADIHERRVLLDGGDWLTWAYPEKISHIPRKKLNWNCNKVQWFSDTSYASVTGVPKHYKMQGCQSIDFVDEVLNVLTNTMALTPKQIYSIKDALKYAIRAGKKGPWKQDAYKCADYLCRAIYGCFLSEAKDTEDKNGQD